ncbi:MAG: hypothetical protein GOMPHAMPRED_002434 [Gomphillus americanus]|uniref:Serpin domain-containing protein n=1 Tax=Gomphillus americanus TaxID=1940652 RepID=A0A8H3FE00_9LECA|nr:MAG: hypothetical protein GOMPHAMPRED_002434 [Gomphillus americanus]
MAENLTESIRRLGWDMLVGLQGTNKSSDGTILSSLSITIAIAMLAGAAGPEQKAKLCAKMGISDPANLADQFATALQTLQTNAGHSLEIANKVFVNDTIVIRDSYVKFLDSLTAGISSYPDLSKEAHTINAWVSEHTRGMISQIVTSSLLKDAQTLLINALAFKGRWQKAFDPKATIKDYPFLSSQDTPRTVEMMFLRQFKVLLADHDNYTAIRLPYKQPDASQSQIYFEAYLPHPNTPLNDILLTLSHSEGLAAFQQTRLASLGLPKFSIETSQDVTFALKQLGYPLDTNWQETIADIRGGSRLANLVIHKAVIEVDEEGTVAAAATALVASRARVKVESRSVMFDRAFAYAVVDDEEMTYFTGVYG